MADTREPSPRSSQVYRGGQPEEDKDDKTKTPGEVLEESGEYLQDPETVDTSQPLQVNTSPSFDIDPTKKPPTERAKEREDRLRNRAGSGQQGADIAKKKLPKSKQTDIPQFLKVTDLQKQDSEENKGWDAENKRIRERYFDDKLKPIPGFEKEIIGGIIEAGKKYGKIKTPQGQMEMIQVAAGMGSAILMGVLQVSRSLMFSY
jgi:hypothetical protein